MRRLLTKALARSLHPTTALLSLTYLGQKHFAKVWLCLHVHLGIRTEECR